MPQVVGITVPATAALRQHITPIFSHPAGTEQAATNAPTTSAFMYPASHSQTSRGTALSSTPLSLLARTIRPTTQPDIEVLEQAVKRSTYTELETTELAGRAIALIDRYQSIIPTFLVDQDPEHYMNRSEIQSWYQLCDSIVHCLGTIESRDDIDLVSVFGDRAENVDSLYRFLSLKHELHLLIKKARRQGGISIPETKRLWEIRVGIYQHLSVDVQRRDKQIDFLARYQTLLDDLQKGKTPSSRQLKSFIGQKLAADQILNAEGQLSETLLDLIAQKATELFGEANDLQPRHDISSLSPTPISVIDRLLFEGIVLELESEGLSEFSHRLSAALDSIAKDPSSYLAVLGPLVGQSLQQFQASRQAPLNDQDLQDQFKSAIERMTGVQVQDVLELLENRISNPDQHPENLSDEPLFQTLFAKVIREHVQLTNVALSPRQWYAPRDWVAQQIPVIINYQVLLANGAPRAHARHYLPLADMGFTELATLRQQLEFAEREASEERVFLKQWGKASNEKAQAQALKNRDGQMARIQPIYDREIELHPDGWLAKAVSEAQTVGSAFPVLTYLRNRQAEASNRFEIQVMKELMAYDKKRRENNDWAERAKAFDVARETAGPLAIHPVFNPDFATPWLIRQENFARNQKIVAALQKRASAVLRNIGPYEVPFEIDIITTEAPLIEPAAPEKYDEMIRKGINTSNPLSTEDGTLIILRHRGFNTRIVLPAEAFTEDGFVKPEFVALVPLMPGAGALHSNVNAMLYSLNALLPQHILDGDGNPALTTGELPARVFPFTYDHPGTIGGDDPHKHFRGIDTVKYNNDMLAWFKAIFVHADQSPLLSVSLGRSFGGNIVQESNHQANTGAIQASYDHSLTFGAYHYTWSPALLTHLYAKIPSGEVRPNLDQLPFILMLDGLWHSGVEAARPFINGEKSSASAELTETDRMNDYMPGLLSNVRPQWEFLGAHAVEKLMAMIEAEETHDLGISHPGINEGRKIGLKEIFGIDPKKLKEILAEQEDFLSEGYPFDLNKVLGVEFAGLTRHFENQHGANEENQDGEDERAFQIDWSELTNDYSAWRAVHKYFATLRGLAGIPEPAVVGMNICGTDGHINLRTSQNEEHKGLIGALDIWPIHTATSGGYLWVGPSGHDPMDARRTEPEVTKRATRDIMSMIGLWYSQLK